MNKRQIQKRKTRDRIIKTAREVFVDKGFLAATTSEIAQQADIAHGTLFLHFINKDNLIVNILDNELEELNKIITKLIENASNFENLLSGYLDFISQREDFFSVIARELPFYNPELRRKILFREAMLRDYFYKTLEKEISERNLVKTDVPSALIFLFATINHYLALKPIYVTKGSVIKVFRKKIISTFLFFLSKGA